jgi:hypothetical protein
MTSQGVLFTYWSVDTVIVFGSVISDLTEITWRLPWSRIGPEVLLEVPVILPAIPPSDPKKSTAPSPKHSRIFLDSGVQGGMIQ